MNGPYLLQFDYLFHNPNPAVDEYLHGDHTHTDEDGNEVVSPGTPDRPVVIDPEPDPDPDPPNANPGPAVPSEPQDEAKTLTGVILTGGDNNDTLTAEGGYSYYLLDGKAGNDILVAADEHVVMIGGPGNDTFDLAPTAIWNDHLGNPFVVSPFTGGQAFIMDFEDGRDKIKIEDEDRSSSLKFFFTKIREAGLTFDMDWIAADTGPDVLLELQNRDENEILIKNVSMAELQLVVMDGDLFIV